MFDGKLRGVNLGGWLVLERWITPSLFEGTDATDEWALSRLPDTYDRIQRHRQTFITEEDFEWIARAGLNAVRIPVGYFVVNDDEPYVPGSMAFIDRALDWAEKCGLQVVLSLHTHPGLANDWNKTATDGKDKWGADSAFRQRSLAALQGLVERVGHRPSLWGIGVLNETVTGGSLSRSDLEEYYRQAHGRISSATGRRVQAVLFDDWKPQKNRGMMAGLDDIAIDTHFYQLFTPEDAALTLQQHIEKALSRADTVRYVQQRAPLIVGEWTGRLPERALAGLDGAGRIEAEVSFARAQLEAYQDAAGWFYWTYKKEQPDGWGLRFLVEQGGLGLDSMEE